MSGFKSFAVAGAGGIGVYIIEELLAHIADGTVSSVVVLTRSESGYDDLKAKGAKFIAVDYSSPASLESALKGIDVVISAVPGPALPVQPALADAAKAAGVKFFVPSEYGNRTIGKTYGIFGVKNALRLHLEEIGLPYALFFNGAFSDWLFVPALGFDFDNNKAIVRGSGDTPVSFTTRTDIASYIVHVLTKLPRSELDNTPFAIEGERTTFNKILEEYQARTGKKLEISYEHREFLQQQIKEHPDEVINKIRGLMLGWDLGEGQSGTPEEVNHYWPEFKPKKAVDAILGA